MTRRPIHVVYGGAHLFNAELCRKLGNLAMRSLEAYAPDAAELAAALGIPEEAAAAVHPRIVEKLRREPVEDYRIDFEDGYGVRSDAEEDAHAEAAASETAKAVEGGLLPPFFGIRIKPLEDRSAQRALRTLDRYLTCLTMSKLPDHFVVTLPKITSPDQVCTLVDALGRHPAAGIELMIETPESVLNLRELVKAAQGRAVAAHFGPYDYTASLGITSAHQTLNHAACDFARNMIQITLAGSGLGLSDGPTTHLPIPPHRGESLSAVHQQENRKTVHRAWKLHYENVRRALGNGYYQGWDLHPAQLVPRYAAVYAFFLEDLEHSAARLRNFLEKAAQATRVGHVFDDAATANGLINHFLRAVNCGALSEADVLRITGVTADQLREGL
jgi:citrate lyase beta subunit